MKETLHHSTQLTSRENFLISLLNKVIREYKSLWETTRTQKPLKIAEISEISPIPGETLFAIQITNKNCTLQLTAAEVIRSGYDLRDFNDYHAEMIRQAAAGKLVEFLKIANRPKPTYKIISKRFDHDIQQFVFTIETDSETHIVRTASELYQEKRILNKMDFKDIYDVGYTQGSESVVREHVELQLAKKKG